MTSKQGYELNIGIDWATSKHDVCIEFPDGKRSFDIIKASPEYIDEWITSHHQKYHGQIAVAVELCKGPIVYALQKYDFVTIFPINPAMLARYRTAFSPSGAKDDPTDAELALDIMLRYPEKIKPLHTQSVEIRKLAFLVEQRRRLVDDKKRYSNRIINTLKQYYPQVLEWFSHRDTQLFSDFLIRWPSLTKIKIKIKIKIKRTRESTVRAFFNKRGGNAVSLLEQRILSIKNAIPLTEDEAVVQSHELLITALAQQLQTVIVAI
jgi:hypothetical protein